MPMQILHLEDDGLDAELIHRAVARQGFVCDLHVVTSRDEFIAALNAGGFSAILSDTGLPGFDGRTALALAREKRPDVPFLVVSGHLGDPRDVERLKQAGVAECVSKSDLDQLVPAIQRALRGHPHTGRADVGMRYSNSMERLVNVVQELSLARDLETVMAIVRSAARDLTGADGATFVLRDHDKCYYADENAIAPLWKGQRFPMSACISGWVMLNRRQVIISDIYADPRIPHEAYRPTFVKSLAMVPIRTLDPLGAIGNYWAKSHTPTAEEVRLLQALADTTAVAMENIRVYSELEQRVKDRTASLEAANGELEAFSYAVSHDLRAPLRHINGFAHLLGEDCGDQLNEAGKSHLQNIQNSAFRMSELIDDLLALSRTTQSALRREPVDLSEIAGEAIENLRTSEPTRQVEVVIAEHLYAECDARLIRVAFENLLSNAWKFTAKKSTPKIEVGSILTDDKQTAYFVRDNGAGFEMKHSARLFGVFQRLHSEAEFPGNGIGLATVRRVIQKHNGKIWAQSVPGEGTTFFFTLG